MDGMTLFDVLHNIMSTFGAIGMLITACGYMLGIGMVIQGILQLKYQKTDNSGAFQLVVFPPISKILVGAMLIYIVSTFSVIGATVFGADATPTTIAGIQNLTFTQNF